MNLLTIPAVRGEDLSKNPRIDQSRRSNCVKFTNSLKIPTAMEIQHFRPDSRNLWISGHLRAAIFGLWKAFL